MLFFQVSRIKNSLQIKERSDSPFHLDGVAEISQILTPTLDDTVKSTQQVFGYFKCYGSIHMGK
jgi:hypothetical protein